MLKLGIVDFDTSHVVEFTKRLNHKGIAEDQWVQGAQVVLGCPGESKIMPERIPGYTKEIENLGVRIVDRPDEMIGKVDGVLIESQEGAPHAERSRPFLEAGLPCFIDKPFTCGVSDARRILELVKSKNAPVFSSSSLRYAPDLVKFAGDANHGKVLGVLSYGPAPYNDRDPARNPGLFHYGIHAVEILYTVMGPGCLGLTCTHEKDTDVVTGHWKDGRVAGVRGIRVGKSEYGFLAFAEKGVTHITLDTRFIYRELLKKIVEFFETKKSPVDVDVTVEIVAFIEAALKSGANHGALTTLS
jgi:predicted dehydrogenase